MDGWVKAKHYKESHVKKTANITRLLVMGSTKTGVVFKTHAGHVVQVFNDQPELKDFIMDAVMQGRLLAIRQHKNYSYGVEMNGHQYENVKVIAEVAVVSPELLARLYLSGKKYMTIEDK